MNQQGAAQGAVGGLMSGAMTGAIIGGVPGAIIGGVAGGILGLVGGGLFGGNEPDYAAFFNRANAAANEQYEASQAAVDNLLANVSGANTAYRQNVNTYTNQFNEAINTAIGPAASFSESTATAEANKSAALAEYQRQAATLATDSAETALKFNEQNAFRINALADSLAAASSKAARDSLFAAQPGLEANLRQMDLNIAADLKGILNTDVAAQVARGAAQTGLGSGIQGEMLQNLTLRDLGLTSYSRMDQGVKNQAYVTKDILGSTVLNADQLLKSRTDLFNTMGLSSDLVVNTNRSTMDTVLGQKMAIEDDRRADASLVLGLRNNAAQYSTGLLANMEQNIYTGTLSTESNAANLMSNAAIARGNTKVGMASQGMQLANSSYVADRESSAAMTSSLMDSTASIFGAYYGSRGGSFSKGGNSLLAPGASNIYTGSTTSIAARPVLLPS